MSLIFIVFFAVDWPGQFASDEHHYYDGSVDPPALYPISSTTILVLMDSSFSTVSIYNGNLRCFCTSNHSRARCPFINVVENKLKDETDDTLVLLREAMNEPCHDKVMYQQTSISQNSIEFCGYVNTHHTFYLNMMVFTLNMMVF